MFSDNLSVSLLQLCDLYKLSYECAAERCGCSSRYFGRIVRRKSCPSLFVFENICIGFGLTPNQLLGVTAIPQPKELSFRIPMPVSQVILLGAGQETTSFPVCPRCGISLEREFQHYCDRCGQSLSWHGLSHASVIRRP